MACSQVHQVPMYEIPSPWWPDARNLWTHVPGSVSPKEASVVYTTHLTNDWPVHISVAGTNPGRQIARSIKFLTVALNICGSLEWNWLHGTHRAPRISRWLLDLCKICAPLHVYTYPPLYTSVSMKLVSIKLCNRYLVCILISDMHATFHIQPVSPNNPNTVWCRSYYAVVSNLIVISQSAREWQMLLRRKSVPQEHLTLLTVQNIIHEAPIWRQLTAAHNAHVSTDLPDLLRPMKPPTASACMSDVQRLFGSRNCWSTSKKITQEPQNS